MKCTECGDTGVYIGAGTLPPEPCRSCNTAAKAINEFVSGFRHDQLPQTSIGYSLDVWGMFALIQREPGEPDDIFRTRVCNRLGINP